MYCHCHCSRTVLADDPTLAWPPAALDNMPLLLLLIGAVVMHARLWSLLACRGMVCGSCCCCCMDLGSCVVQLCQQRTQQGCWMQTETCVLTPTTKEHLTAVAVHSRPHS